LLSEGLFEFVSNAGQGDPAIRNFGRPNSGVLQDHGDDDEYYKRAEWSHANKYAPIYAVRILIVGSHQHDSKCEDTENHGKSAQYDHRPNEPMILVLVAQRDVNRHAFGQDERHNQPRQKCNKEQDDHPAGTPGKGLALLKVCGGAAAHADPWQLALIHLIVV